MPPPNELGSTTRVVSQSVSPRDITDKFTKAASSEFLVDSRHRAIHIILIWKNYTPDSWSKMNTLRFSKPSVRWRYVSGIVARNRF